MNGPENHNFDLKMTVLTQKYYFRRENFMIFDIQQIQFLMRAKNEIGCEMMRLGRFES